MVGRRQVGRVVDGDRVVAVAAGRLDGDEHVAEVEAAEHQRVVVDALAPGAGPHVALELGPGLGSGSVANQRRVVVAVAACRRRRRAAAAVSDSAS